MNTPDIFFLMGALTMLLPLVAMLLFDFLRKRKQQKNAKGGEDALGVPSLIADTPDGERGEAQHPNDQNSGWPVRADGNGDVTEHPSSSLHGAIPPQPQAPEATPTTDTPERDDIRRCVHDLIDAIEFTADDLRFLAVVVTMAWGTRPGSALARLRSGAAETDSPRAAPTPPAGHPA